jgi:hypothetical protein
MNEPQRRSLQVVAHAGAEPTAIEDPPDGTDGDVDDTDGREEWRARSVIRKWSPEHQLIGALMHMSAEDAGPILELVSDSAVWRPITRKALQVIRTLVAEGRDPDPVVVLRAAEARSTGASTDGPRANEWTVGDSGSRHHQFVLYLADAYTEVLDPSHVRAYAREVLGDAYRRAFRFHGVRMQQLAETHTARDDLIQYLRVMQDELAFLSRCAELATQADARYDLTVDALATEVTSRDHNHPAQPASHATAAAKFGPDRLHRS